MKKILPVLARSAAASVVLTLVFFYSASFTHASGSLTSSQTVANFTTVNDQTDVTTPTIANLPQAEGSITITFNSLPVASSTTSIGNCLITYSTTVADALNCSGNNAIVNTVTHSTTSTLAAAIRSFSAGSVVDANQGSLAVSGSTNTVTWTATSTVTVATPIAFTDTGTLSAISVTASTTPVVAVAQKNTVTIGGTVEANDIFSVGIPTGYIAYKSQISDSTLANIANGLGAAIVASSTYSGQPFTVATSSNTVVFTAKTAGTGFTQISSTTNSTSTPIAQVVTFTPSGTSGAENYTVILNSSSYTYNDTSGIVADILSGLVSVLTDNSAANCSVSATLVTCTAKTAGTGFTFSAGTAAPSSQASSGGSTGGGGGFSESIAPVAHVTPTSVVTPVTSVTPKVPSITVIATTNANTGSTNGASKIKKTLHYGNENTSVKILQQLLASDASLDFTGTISGYFGLKTRAAVEAFQVKYGIVAAGAEGYGSVGPKTRAELVAVFGQ